jgi:hypothetical protein
MANVPPIQPGNTAPSSRIQVVQIVSLPEALQNNPRTVRVEGEVVQQNKDGSTRIRTLDGDIDIVVQGRQPREGQKIQVDIPPGNPPRTANIRPAPVQAPPPVPQTLPAPTVPQQSYTPPVVQQPGTPVPQTPVPRPAPGTPAPLPPTGGNPQPSTAPPTSTTELPDIYQPAPQTGTTPPAKPVQNLPPLAPGQTITLIPMEEFVPVSGATVKIMTMVAQKSESALITNLLGILKSALPPALLPKTISESPATVAPPTPQAMNTQPIPILSAKIISLTLPSGQTVTAPVAPAAQPIMSAPPLTPMAPTSSATPQAPLLTVMVSELTPQGQPVLPIPVNDMGGVQKFIVQLPPAAAPPGTQITLQPQIISPQTPNTLTTPHSPQSGVPLQTTTNSALTMITPQVPVSALPPAWRALLPVMQPSPLWPAMDELFQSFYQATPQAAQILGRIIPSPANGANFGPAILLFAAALKSGDLQAWLGDKKLDMLQKIGKGGLIGRLSGETAQISNAPDAAATEWKSFPVPLLWQNEISKIMFHVRKEPSENEQETGEGGTRFVMDLSLNRMGEVQLDGLVRGQRLDLIIRTQNPISFPMQEAMATAYAAALDGTNIYGEIGFQSDKRGWENIVKRNETLTASV